MMARCLALLVAASILAGCQTDQFRSRRLGDVDYNAAYQAGLGAMSNYFTIQSADAKTGRIVAQPQPASPTAGKIVSSTQGREVAVLQITRDSAGVVAGIRVDIQRQEEPAYQSFSQMYSNTDVPNQTPAQREAALSPEQVQAWRTVGHNYDMERRILDDIYNSTRPTPKVGGPLVIDETTTQPTTAE